MRFSSALFVLCCAISLPACLAANEPNSSSDPALDSGFDFGFHPGLTPECGCVFPSSDPDVSVAAICGEAVCFEEAADSSDGEFDLTDYSLTCEAKAGCTFLLNGECVGSPLPCSSRIQAACTEFGGECFLVNLLET